VGLSAKIRVEVYIEPKVLRELLDLKADYEEVIGQKISESKWLAMCLKHSRRNMKRFVKRLQRSLLEESS